MLKPVLVRDDKLFWFLIVLLALSCLFLFWEDYDGWIDLPGEPAALCSNWFFAADTG